MTQDEIDLITSLKLENQALKAENQAFKERFDGFVNLIALQREEIQQLKDEIATLKGQKPRPKIPPSILEGDKSKDKQKNKIPRGKHLRRKKTNQLQIHAKQRIKRKSLKSHGNAR